MEFYTSEDKQNYIKILRASSAQLDTVHQRQLRSLLQNTREQKRLLTEILEQSAPQQNTNQTFMAICGGMNEYLAEVRKPAYTRQQIWELFDTWLRQIHSYFNMITDFPEDWAERPIIEEKAVTMIKALHARDGVTKQELCEKLGIKGRMVQNLLRAIDPSLQNDGTQPTDKTLVRFGGQVMHTKIYCEKRAHEEWRYYTPETIHPLAFQWNVMQVGSALMAFFQATAQDRYICQYLAIDLWAQLSKYGKQRIRDIFGNLDAGFLRFLEDLEDSEHDTGVAAFCPESVQQKKLGQELSVLDNLIYAMKSRAVVSVLLRDGEGKETMLEHQCVWEGEKDYWYVMPAELKNREDEIEISVFQRFGILVEEKRIQRIYFTQDL
jgi:hypothetical protein